MPTLSFHASSPLARRLKQRAKAAKVPLSSYLAATVERGLAHEPPKISLGALAGTAEISPDYDPAAPVFPPKEWSQ